MFTPSTSWLGKLFVDAATPIVIEDLDGLVVAMNPEAERVYGWNCEELVGKPIKTLLPQSWQESADDLLRRCLRGESVRNVESRRLTRDGEERPVLLTLSLLKDGDRPVAIASFAQDITAYHEVEQKLRERNAEVVELAARDKAILAQLDAIVQQMDEALTVYDPDGRLLLINAAAQAAHEEACRPIPSDLKGYFEEVEVLEVDRDVPIPREMWPATRALRGESFRAEEVRVRWRGADELGVQSYSGRMVRDADGEPLFAIVTMRDVTERHQAWQAVRAEKERFRQLADSMPQLVWTATADGIVDYYNARSREFAGIDEEEGEAWSWRPVIHPDDREVSRQAWERAVKTGERYEIEHRALRVDGTYRWYLSRASLARGPGGGEARWYGTATDIDDFKRAQAELHESRERLRLALEAGALGVWSLEVGEGRFDFDETCQRHFDVPPSLPMGELLERIHPDDYLSVMETFSMATVPGEVEDYRIECRVRVGQEYRWVHGMGRGQFDLEHGARHADRILGVVQDITERKAVEEQLREADHRKDEFLAMLGHELRNPLAAIANGVRVIERRGEVTEEVLPMVERHLSQMSRLLDDLLDISRITRGKLSIDAVIQPLRPILEAAVDAVRPRIEEYGHTLTVYPIDDVPVLADTARLQQIVSNLLDNAVSYTPPGGHIRLWARAKDQSVVLGVRDDGRGIAAEALEEIFEPFVQGAHEQRRGLGIGLALVRRLVELHGGRVEAHSGGEGRGTEFLITLPRPEEVELVDEQPSPTLSRCAQGLRVLAVDDNADAARLMAMLLEDRGCTVDVVHDGRSCLQKARQEQYDVVLLDIGLPDLDGREVARRLRKMPGYASTLLVAVSGYTQANDIRASLEAGFDAHLGKPVSPDCLDEVISGHIPADERESPTTSPPATTHAEPRQAVEPDADDPPEGQSGGEEEAEEAEEQTRREDPGRAMARLLGQLDHDVRGPLGAVVSTGWVLRRGVDPALMYEVGEDLEAASRRITAMVSRARDHGSLQALGEAALSRRPADPAAIVEALTANLQSGRRDPVELSVNLEEGAHGSWDVDRLGTALARLLEPWIERGEGPRIEARLVGQEVELEVDFPGPLPPLRHAGDEGVGLDEPGADLDYLERLVELHHGSIIRDDDGGKQSRLRIELPGDDRVESGD